MIRFVEHFSLRGAKASAIIIRPLLSSIILTDILLSLLVFVFLNTIYYLDIHHAVGEFQLQAG